MSFLRSAIIALLISLAVHAYSQGVPDNSTQLILGTAATWNSMRGELRLFERAPGGEWHSVAGSFPVLFGKNGLAWGTGLAGQNESGIRKQERDGRAPAGVFEIGQVFGYEPQLPAGDDADVRTHGHSSCPPEVIIHITRLLKRTFGAMIHAHPITIATL